MLRGMAEFVGWSRMVMGVGWGKAWEGRKTVGVEVL